MKKLIKARHWQLFILIVGIHIVFQIIMIADGGENMRFYVQYLSWVWLIPVIVYYAWLWSIFFQFKGYAPKGSRTYKSIFVISWLLGLSFVFISSLYAVTTGFPNENSESDLLGWLNLMFAFCTVCCIGYTSRINRIVELNRAVKLRDYIGDVFLMFLYPIGIWIMQPRINQTADKISATEKPNASHK